MKMSLRREDGRLLTKSPLQKGEEGVATTVAEPSEGCLYSLPKQTTPRRFAPPPFLRGNTVAQHEISAIALLQQARVFRRARGAKGNSTVHSWGHGVMRGLENRTESP